MATVPKNTGLYKINSVLFKKKLVVSIYPRYSDPTEAITQQATKGNNMNAQELANKIVADALAELNEQYFCRQFAGLTVTCRAIGMSCPFDADTMIEAAELAAERIAAYAKDL